MQKKTATLLVAITFFVSQKTYYEMLKVGKSFSLLGLIMMYYYYILNFYREVGNYW